MTPLAGPVGTLPFVFHLLHARQGFFASTAFPTFPGAILPSDHPGFVFGIGNLDRLFRAIVYGFETRLALIWTGRVCGQAYAAGDPAAAFIWWEFAVRNSSRESSPFVAFPVFCQGVNLSSHHHQQVRVTGWFIRFHNHTPIRLRFLARNASLLFTNTIVTSCVRSRRRRVRS